MRLNVHGYTIHITNSLQCPIVNSLLIIIELAYTVKPVLYFNSVLRPSVYLYGNQILIGTFAKTLLGGQLSLMASARLYFK